MLKIPLKKLIQKMDKKYRFNLSADKQKEITKDLVIAGVSEVLVNDEIGEAINLILSRIKQENIKTYSPLNASIEAAIQQELSSCPLCQKKMEIIELVGKKKAYYCDVHRVCLPMPTGE